ncbi:hypothetical protein A2553_01120 [Candidatus Nomurabacteria bacterium RIFOXYD2_FULL_42_12]|nr:MAG: hypothetical protein A2553_01120 [Candidatus Nomurabacteria bacterium RIFOXYD2_FULL_42_12]
MAASSMEGRFRNMAGYLSSAGIMPVMLPSDSPKNTPPTSTASCTILSTDTSNQNLTRPPKKAKSVLQQNRRRTTPPQKARGDASSYAKASDGQAFTTHQ